MKMMNTFNKLTLDITVAIIDFLYKGRDYQRFWVLEEIARAPYFAFLSVLHLRESILIGLIAFSPDTLYLSTIGSTWFIIGWLLALLTISPTK
jgi:hypothetical protein